LRGSRGESTVSHGPEIGSEWTEKIDILWVEVSGWGLLGEKFLEVGWHIAMDALVGEEGIF